MNRRPLIIAEAGVNHNGSLDSALQLVEVAKKCGADVVKFQTFSLDEMVSVGTPLAPYQSAQGGEVDQMELLSKLSLSESDFRVIKEYSDKVGIEFLSTAFDVESFEFLVGLGIRRAKIPSGEITNFPLLRCVADSGLPVIMSTGMADSSEVSAALEVVSRGPCLREITLLQCVTAYPTPDEEANVSAMSTLASEFGFAVGYSDHTLGSLASILAVSLGASVIEKHVTLDRALPGPDHQASLDPAGFRRFVDDIERARVMLGSGVKEASLSELENLVAARKSVYFRRSVASGSIIQEADLVSRRPGNGVSPMQWMSIVGSLARRDFEAGERFEW